MNSLEEIFATVIERHSTAPWDIELPHNGVEILDADGATIVGYEATELDKLLSLEMLEKKTRDFLFIVACVNACMKDAT